MWVTTTLTVAPDWESLLRKHRLDTVEGIYGCNLGTVVTGSGTTESWQVELKDPSLVRVVS